MCVLVPSTPTLCVRIIHATGACVRTEARTQESESGPETFGRSGCVQRGCANLSVYYSEQFQVFSNGLV